MTSEEVRRTLHVLRNTYENLIDPAFADVLRLAEAEVKASAANYKEGKISSWGYSIHWDHPLTFIPSRNRGVPMVVEVSCNIRWNDDSVPVQQGLRVRVWCDHRDTIFDPNDPTRDQIKVEEFLANVSHKRVVTRFHMDRHIQGGEEASEKHKGSKRMSEHHPEYHLQFGGHSEDNEYCLIPKSIDVPRFPHQPMELFLTCQLIAASYFPIEYQDIKANNEWKGELYNCQQELLAGYYEHCFKLVTTKTSLLDDLAPPDLSKELSLSPYRKKAKH